MKKKNALGGDGRARTSTLMIMLTEDEKKAINEKAYRFGMSASTWVRVVILKMCRGGE